ncbi:MAG: MFS transporter [Deltaproteobacteria bacterium]|nr:MAG: MFS transporter [Deltaproteobacteria bacterium]TMQ06337.1 MAG: MFS transporter [Deltaproteobacteria bacterium]
MSSRIGIKLGVVVSAAFTFAAVLASYSAFRPVRDALILDRDPESLPWLWLGTFVVISIASPVWSAVVAGRAPRRFVAPAYHVFAACLVGFVVAVRAVPAGSATAVVVGRVFYVWSAVFNLFAVSVFWSLLADLLGPRIARQLYGPIAAGGTVGGLIGPLLTKLLVGAIGVAGVLAVSAVLLELAVVGIAVVRRVAGNIAPEERPAAEPEVLPGGGPFTGIAQVARTPYLAAIVGYVLCTACAATFLYLAQARIVYAAHLTVAARTDFFASIDVWTQAITFVLQVVVAGAAIRWLGPGLVLAVLPIAQAVGLSVVAASPSLAAIAVVQVIGKSATHGLTRPARELLFTVVSRDDKYRAKNAIDTVGYRLGDLASSWLNKGLAALGGTALALGGTALALATIPLVAIWLAVTAIAGLGFRRRVALQLAEPAAAQPAAAQPAETPRR